MLHSLSPGHSVHRGQISVSADREEQLWDRRHSGRCLAKHPEAKMASIASAFLKRQTEPAAGRLPLQPFADTQQQNCLYKTFHSLLHRPLRPFPALRRRRGRGNNTRGHSVSRTTRSPSPSEAPRQSQLDCQCFWRGFQPRRFVDGGE